MFELQQYTDSLEMAGNWNGNVVVYQMLLPLIEKCREEKDIDNQIEMLYTINDSLSHTDRIQMPSFLTDDYCRRALEMIEEKITRALRDSSREFNWP